jgi:hypothetical protein
MVGHTSFLCWRNSLFGGVLISLGRWSGEGGENSITLVRTMDMSIIIILGGVQVPTLWGCACLAIIMRHMMVGIDPAAQVRVRAGTRARRRS